MNDGLYVQRNDALAFAVHTRQNLEVIEECFGGSAAFHPVTQLVNSVLGLIVFLREREFDKHIAGLALDELVQKGWPQIEMSGERCETLGKFIYHLRNAVAHGRMRFSSDSRDLNRVTVSFEDCKHKTSTPYWDASISATELRQVCLKFIALLEDTIG